MILANARKHGVADNDMLHACRNPIRVFRVDDLVMLIGATKRGDSSRWTWQQLRVSSSWFTPCQLDRSS